MGYKLFNVMWVRFNLTKTGDEVIMRKTSIDWEQAIDIAEQWMSDIHWNSYTDAIEISFTR